MKELFVNMLIGIPAVLILIGALISAHSLLGENTFPVLFMTALLIVAGAASGLGIRRIFAKTTVAHRLNRWIRK